ncbi:MAG: hypothetical protein WCI60_03750 [bacterium]
MTDAVAPQATTTATKVVPEIKIASPSLVALGNEALPIDYMTDLIFEDIGGQEMINISRNDIINGQNIIYQPIKNITDIFLQYNPQNILKLQDTSAAYFRNFPIHLEDKIPNCGAGYTLQPVTLNKVENCNIVYVDPVDGSIVISVINLEKNEQIEVQIMSQGSILSDTIYTVTN